MIPFKTPQLSMTLSEYMSIVTLQAKAGSCAGFLIGLGKTFFDKGVAEVDEKILPQLTSMAPGYVNPRVMPSYAILLWFSLKVSQSFVVDLIVVNLEYSTTDIGKGWDEQPQKSADQLHCYRYPYHSIQAAVRCIIRFWREF